MEDCPFPNEIIKKILDNASLDTLVESLEVNRTFNILANEAINDRKININEFCLNPKTLKLGKRRNFNQPIKEHLKILSDYRKLLNTHISLDWEKEIVQVHTKYWTILDIYEIDVKIARNIDDIVLILSCKYDMVDVYKFYSDKIKNNNEIYRIIIYYKSSKITKFIMDRFASNNRQKNLNNI